VTTIPITPESFYPVFASRGEANQKYKPKRENKQ